MFQNKLKKIISSILVLSVYFLVRIQNIQSIPVFCDEAIYLRWSQIIRNVETLRFIPLTDGKQPLFMWITAVFFKFINDPLVAGRLLSILSGAGIIILLLIFSQLFFRFRVGLIASILYIFLPFTFFFDRLSLADTLLSFFGLLSLILSFLIAKYPRLDLSLILGFSLGLAWLTKSPALYFIVLSFISFLIYNFKNIKKIYLPVISSVIATLIYSILRLGPQFHQIALRNYDYVWPLSEVIKHPFDPLMPHISDIFTLFSIYISIPIILLGLFGLIITHKKNLLTKTNLIIFLWWILPLIANSAIAKVFTARYILFTLPPLILLLSFGINSIFNLKHQIFRFGYIQTILLVLCFIPNLIWIYKISFNPFDQKLPPTESGYNSGWTSGWGIKTASEYLIKRSLQANVIVGTEGYFGTLPDGIQIYTNNIPKLTIFGVGIDINEIPEKLIDARNHGDEVYLLFNQSRLKLTPSAKEKVILISSYPKPSQDNLLLLKLK